MQKQILPATISRQLYQKNYEKANDSVSWWHSFWTSDLINAVLQKNWYKRRGKNKIDKSNEIKGTIKELKNERFPTIGFLIMDSNFKILSAMVAMVWPG